ncbi:MAG: hypothetical protein MR727_08685 [Lentisphaeria bacterium]|nr:hypothetical protein [Lentisphaeria bacterium]
MKKNRLPILAGMIAAVQILTGCSTVVNAHRQKSDIMANYVAGRFPAAQEELEYELREPAWYNSSKVNTGDEVMWRVEAGALNCLMGKDEQSIRHFERAEALIEDFDERAVVNLREAGAEASVLLTNPNALPYRGWCRDRIMIPVYKAFAYLGKGDEKGFQTELYRLRSNQDAVMDQYEKFFEAEDRAMEKEKARNRAAASSVNPDAVMRDSRNGELNGALNETNAAAHRGYAGFLNPFSIFLSAYGYVRKGSWQNALVDHERLYRAAPGNPLVRQYYVTSLLKTGRSIPPELKGIRPLDFSLENGNVLVVFANGRSAALRQIQLYIPVIIPRYYATLAAVAWPVCEFYPAPFRTLNVSAGGRDLTTTPVADMDGILAAEYNKRLPGMILRICLSTAVKEFAAFAATRAASQANEWAGVATAVGTSIYKIAFNTADTRTWEILPKEFQIAQFAMPEDRRLVLAPDNRNPATIHFPDDAGSAIVFVNAPGPSPHAFTYRVFNLKN